MSHFNLMVLVKDNVRDIEKQVKMLMAPYDENKRMPRYERDCHCIGDVARNEARDAAEAKFPSWDQLRDQFHLKNGWINTERKEWNEKWKKAENLPAIEKKALKKEYQAWDEKGDKLFQQFIAPKQNFIDNFIENHPMRKKPDPTCGFYSQSMIDGMRKSEPGNKKYMKLKAGDRYDDKSGCGGTGRIVTASNPKGQWDWYEIGGRWTGDFVEDYDPYKDPDNLETCFLCRGTGKRDDQLGAAERLKDPEYTCNGCDGKGKSLKHQLKRFPGDILPTLLVPKDYEPHAVITPDGEWHQEATMGWFGMCGKKNENWSDMVAGFLKKYRDNTIAVVVDCHT